MAVDRPSRAVRTRVRIVLDLLAEVPQNEWEGPGVWLPLYTCDTTAKALAKLVTAIPRDAAVDMQVAALLGMSHADTSASPYICQTGAICFVPIAQR